MLGKSYSLNALSAPPRRSKAKTYILAAIMAALVATAHMLYTGFQEVAEEKWQENEPAYDVKSEFNQSVFLIFARIKLIENGFDPDGWLLKSLGVWHQSVYESVLTKIPPTDIQRITFWYDSVYLPQAFSRKYDPALIKDILSYAKMLRDGEAKSPFVDKVERLNLLEDFAISYMQFDASLTEAEREKWDRFFLETITERVPAIDLDYFINHPKRISTLLNYIYTSHKFLAHLLYKRNYQEICPEKVMQSWLKVRSFSETTVERVENLPLLDDANLSILEKIRNNNKNATQGILAMFPVCKININ